MSRSFAWVWLAAGCGAHAASADAVKVFHPPAPRPAVDADGLQVSGEPIAAAWDAVGQSPLPARVAVYSADAKFADLLGAALPGVQGIADTYVIPGYLVDGRQGYPSPYYPYGYGMRPNPVDLDQLRQIAALAHCDVLLVADHGYRQDVKANTWVATTVLLVPALMVPFLHITDHSYVDAHVFDVRNGYLYGQVRAEAESERGPTTVYAADRPGVRREQSDELLTDLRQQVSDLLWHHLLVPQGP